jgi:hypothetical protein
LCPGNVADARPDGPQKRGEQKLKFKDGGRICPARNDVGGVTDADSRPD